MFVIIVIAVLANTGHTKEVTICDCTKASNNEILQLTEDSCNIEPTGTPIEAKYEVWSHRRHSSIYVGHICIVNKKEKTINDKIVSDTTATRSLQPRLSGCLAMAGLNENNHVCMHPSKIMKKRGDKWVYASEPIN